MTSSDGIAWTKRISGTINDFREVIYGNNTFVVVGGRDGIIPEKKLMAQEENEMDSDIEQR